VTVYIDFKLNQDYIAEFLCVNKNRDDIKCNGQCHLNLKLNDVDQKSSDETPKELTQNQVSYIFVKQNILPLTSPDIKKADSPMQECVGYSFAYSTELLKPPQ
jgi:hypothetical protein